MARHKDYYEILGVSRHANEDELKKSYRELARKTHPDINPSAKSENQFKEINQAYSVLSDSKLRAKYDRYGHSAVSGVQSGPEVPGFSGVVEAFDDLIGDVLRKRRRAKERGADLRYTLELDLVEASMGTEKTISVPSVSGKDKKEREFLVTIPPGTKDGALRRIKGEGGKSDVGGAPGDLNVIIRIREHEVLVREGKDIWSEVPVRLNQAALGAIVTVPTLEGPVKMRIPQGTQSGRVLRLRGKGVPSGKRGDKRGDQLVKVLVETPSLQTNEQKEWLSKMDQLFDGDAVYPLQEEFSKFLD